ncbi:MAG: DUF502 domain-containing protein [Pseudomonadota bacterium]|nr:DUF502 domain-containing protein [Pseudomonadota bacterium]
MPKHSFMARAQRYLLTGVVTVVPLWITWWVLQLILSWLSSFSLPWIRALSKQVNGSSAVPALDWLGHPWVQTGAAAGLTIIALYFLGWVATFVVGRRLIALVDALFHRIPLVQTVYGGTKKLLAALEQQHGELQRVVLIEFPTPRMKAVGFVTRVLKDQATGAELAAVYVPTTPNPTSGYVEIVPVGHLVSLDWSIDEAMSFIISGGSIAPDYVRYSLPEEDKPA